MTYKECIDYIEKLQTKRGIFLALGRIKEALEYFGNPQDAVPAIHVAGTNGKGSVCAYISALLRANGVKTGQFCSPKIEAEHDCISINQKTIAKQAFAGLITKITGTSVGAKLSAFELMTVSAFIYFRDKKCKLNVIEAGMGGVFDATNVIAEPLACVFTPISIDHTQYLGNTLEEITKNKCGMIKKTATVISASQKDDVKAIIAKHTDDITGRDAIFINHNDILTGSLKPDLSSFHYRKIKGVKIKMPGLHQIQNAALALEVISKLGFAAVPQALGQVCVPGRFETIAIAPRIIMDGAHNRAGAASLAKTVIQLFSDKARIIILGILSDKDYNGIINELTKCAHYIITVPTVDTARGLGSLELARAATAFCKRVTAADSVYEALDLARTLAGVHGVIIATGSLTYLPMVRKIVLNERQS